MLRYMLLAAFVLGTMAQDSSQECEEVSMTVKGGLCDGMKAPEKVCGGKSIFPGDSDTWVRSMELNV